MYIYYVIFVHYTTVTVRLQLKRLLHVCIVSWSTTELFN